MAETSTTPSAGSMLSSVSSLQRSIQAAQERVSAQSSNASGSTAAPSNVQEFRKDIRKSPFNTLSAATDIGILTRNSSRLNVISALSPSDTVDFYKFKVTHSSEVTLGQAGGEGLRIQVMTRLGAVVADSNEQAGNLRENFQKMQEGSFSLNRGDYVLRVTREKGTSAKESTNYALQLRMGTYSRDYDTVAREPTQADRYPQTSAASQKLQDMLNTGAANIRSLPAIGTSATSKLLGTVFNVSA